MSSFSGRRRISDELGGCYTLNSTRWERPKRTEQRLVGESTAGLSWLLVMLGVRQRVHVSCGRRMNCKCCFWSLFYFEEKRRNMRLWHFSLGRIARPQELYFGIEKSWSWGIARPQEKKLKSCQMGDCPSSGKKVEKLKLGDCPSSGKTSLLWRMPVLRKNVKNTEILMSFSNNQSSGIPRTTPVLRSLHR